MNKKTLIVFTAFLILAMTLTPLALAKPGAEKNNEKFEYFELIVSGEGSGTNEKSWTSPPDGAPPNAVHTRGGGWDTTSVDLVELTVGGETFDLDSDPYSVDYTTTFDIEVHLDEVGDPKTYNIRLTDVVTVYDEDVEIGTLILKIKAVVDFTGAVPTYTGTVMGYGTGDLKGVHISAQDYGLVDPVLLRYLRIGTITGWPDYITNT